MREGLPLAPPEADLRCDVPFGTIPGLENPSAFTSRDAGIVDDPEDFCRLWQEAAMPETPCDSGAVDWAREVVLVAGGTWYNTTGYSQEVTCIQAGEEPGSLEGHLLLHAPGDGCLTGHLFTNPLAIVKVPRPAGSVTFQIDRAVLHPCH